MTKDDELLMISQLQQALSVRDAQLKALRMEYQSLMEESKMIGGNVLAVRETKDAVLVIVRGRKQDHDEDKIFGIFVSKTGERPCPGDEIWWQHSIAMIHHQGERREIRTEKIGHSFDVVRMAMEVEVTGMRVPEVTR